MYAPAFDTTATQPKSFLIDRDGHVRKICDTLIGHLAEWKGWVEELL